MEVWMRRGEDRLNGTYFCPTGKSQRTQSDLLRYIEALDTDGDP
jgi:hypothetical protein